MARAVHWLQRQQTVVLVLRGEHVLAELLPVARLLPQYAVDELRRLDLDIARVLEPPAHIGFGGPVKRPALGVPEHRADRLLLDMEQVPLAAAPPMVALLGLLQTVEIGLQRHIGKSPLRDRWCQYG